MNFAIISNSQHQDLYEESKSFYSNLTYPLIRVPGNNGYYGFKFVNPLFIPTLPLLKICTKYSIVKHVTTWGN